VTVRELAITHNATQLFQFRTNIAFVLWEPGGYDFRAVDHIWVRVPSRLAHCHGSVQTLILMIIKKLILMDRMSLLWGLFLLSLPRLTMLADLRPKTHIRLLDLPSTLCWHLI
jgi:hypothetical protein